MTVHKAIEEQYAIVCYSQEKMLAVKMDFPRRTGGVYRLWRIFNEGINRRMKYSFTTVRRIESRRLIQYTHLMKMEDNLGKQDLNYVPIEYIEEKEEESQH